MSAAIEQDAGAAREHHCEGGEPMRSVEDSDLGMGWMDGDGWIDGWMDGWVDGWVDRWMDEWVGGCMDAWMVGWRTRMSPCTHSSSKWRSAPHSVGTFPVNWFLFKYLNSGKNVEREWFIVTVDVLVGG